LPPSRPGAGRSRLSALRHDDDLDEGLVALPGVPVQGGVLRLSVRPLYALFGARQGLLLERMRTA
jgi:hypothetical protein